MLVGSLGTCQGITITVLAPQFSDPSRISTDGQGVPFGCPGGQSFLVAVGTENINTNTDIQTDIFDLTTTTNTFQLQQTYDLGGHATSCNAEALGPRTGGIGHGSAGVCRPSEALRAPSIVAERATLHFMTRVLGQGLLSESAFIKPNTLPGLPRWKGRALEHGLPAVSVR
jgi:hypothetical protein